MYELRILSGLKSGISFSLDKEPLYIGSSDDSDILMLDRSFLGAAFSAKETEDRKIEVFFTEGDFKDINGNPLSDTCILEPKDVFFHKDVWLQIASTEAPWLNQIPVVKPQPVTPSVKPSKKIPTILAGGVCSALIFGLYNLSYANQSEQQVSSFNSSSQSFSQYEQKTSAAIQNATKVTIGKIAAGAVVQFNHLETLESMLRERELNGLRIIKQDNQIVLEGSLSKRDQDVLSRMLMRYEFEYPDSPFVKNATERHGDDFPIKVAAVVSGPYGHVLLEDGTRLYKGQIYQGYRLVNIHADVIEFKGDKKVTVRW